MLVRNTLLSRVFTRVVAAGACLLLTAACAFAQQEYVGKYDIYGGFGYLNSPKISLSENGFHTQAGMRMNRWLSLGFDYTVVTGDGALVPSLLPTSLQQTLGAQLGGLAAAGKLPPGYALKVPISSNTQTFSLGPQVSYRHFRQFTLFARPDLGAIREVATPKPADPIASAILAQLAPSGKKQDWTYFYGFGGGIDVNITKKFSIRVQADFVRDHLFNDLLKDSRNTVRFAIGPGFQWGRNVE